MNLEFLSKKNNIGIILNDAGSANQITFIFKALKLNKNIYVYSKEPGRSIWEKEFGSKFFINDYEKFIAKCEILLVGTGFPRDELNILKRIKEKNIPSIALIDHYVNYKSRFLHERQLILPDTIWVSDDKAFNIASHLFNKKCKILKIYNYYLCSILEQISKINVKQGCFLYLSEPLKGTWNKKYSCDREAIQYCLEKISKGTFGKIKRFTIRPHPADVKKNFLWLEKVKKPFEIKIDTNNEISTSIGEAEFVAGCDTYALKVSLLSKRKTFFSYPPYAPESKLPFKEIKYIRDF